MSKIIKKWLFGSVSVIGSFFLGAWHQSVIVDAPISIPRLFMVCGILTIVATIVGNSADV